MKNEPEPPYLVIRSGRAFWVEHRAPHDCSARLQAFREGCFREAYCYDASGTLWEVADARLKRRLSLFERLFQTRWVPVELHLGPGAPATLEDVVGRLADVLRGDSEFRDHLRESPEALLRRFEGVRNPHELILLAQHAA
jgi:hypothetical protein